MRTVLLWRATSTISRHVSEVFLQRKQRQLQQRDGTVRELYERQFGISLRALSCWVVWLCVGEELHAYVFRFYYYLHSYKMYEHWNT